MKYGLVFLLSCLTADPVAISRRTMSRHNSLPAQNGADWGTIKGKITWGGKEIPEKTVLKLPAENQAVPACIAANNGKLPAG